MGFLFLALGAALLHGRQDGGKTPFSSAPLALPSETHLTNVRQITIGGQNAEAYFSADDKYLIIQHQGQFYDSVTHAPGGPNVPCDQIYMIAVETPNGKPATPKPISNGKGKTTCSYFFPSGKQILYSSTFAASPECPPRPDYSQGYVWPVHDTYLIYTADLDGGYLRPRLRRATTPRRRFRATASIPCSHPRETATSTSTRWTPTVRTSAN